MVTIFDLLFFLFIIIGGILLEMIFQQLYFKISGKKLKKNYFSWSKYFFMLIPISIAIALYTFKFGSSITKVFMIFSIIGTCFEWAIGFLYHQIMGQRLWTYHNYSIQGYSSFLTIPLWGTAGVLFWLLAQVFSNS
jgi:hypothetical protein